jgi:uncharacterized protein
VDYVDTSVLLALIVNELHSAAVEKWYADSKAPLVSAAWCVPEFTSALGIKQRTKQLDAEQAASAWERFGRLVAHDLQLLPVEPAAFHRAAVMVLDAANALRAGDALHLACAEQAGANSVATLDAAMARNAQGLKMKALAFV